MCGDTPLGTRTLQRAARSLGRTHRPRLPGGGCLRATSWQRPPCVPSAACHMAKRKVGVWYSLPMLGPCAQRQHHTTRDSVLCLPTDIHSLLVNNPLFLLLLLLLLVAV